MACPDPILWISDNDLLDLLPSGRNPGRLDTRRYAIGMLD